MTSIVTVPIQIQVRGKKILLKDDSISLYQYQIDKINRYANRKTQIEWINSSKGIEIKLTPFQQQQVISTKEAILDILSFSRDPKQLLLRKRGYGFTNHAFERVLGRIERLSDEQVQLLGPQYKLAVHPETLERLTESIINSKEATAFAEWKGYPYLNYGLVCNLDDRELEVIVNFEIGILVVTMIVEKETGYFVREVYSFDGENK